MMSTLIATRRWLRRISLFLLALVIVLCLLVAGLQTGPGKRLLLSGARWFVNHYTDYELEIEGLSGMLPTHVQLTALRLCDERGPFVDVAGVTVGLSLAPLLRGRLCLNAVELDQITVWNKPIPKEKKQPLPTLPDIPDWIEVQTLKIGRLTMGEAVIGKEVHFHIAGKVSPVRGRYFPEVEFQLEGLDEAETVNAVFACHYAEGLPQIHLEGRDDKLLPEFLALPSPVIAEVEGVGGRDDWKGMLRLTAGGEVVAEGNAALMEETDATLSAALQLAVSQLPVLRDHSAWVGDTLDAHVALYFDEKGALTIQRCELKAALIEAAVEGNLDPDEKTLALTLHAAHKNIALLLGMDSNEEEQAALLTVTAAGPYMALDIKGAVSVADTQVLEAALEANVDEKIRLAGTVSAWPGRLAPLQAWCDEDDLLRLSFGSVLDTDGATVVLEESSFSFAGLQGMAGARYAWDQPDLNVNARWELPALQEFIALGGDNPLQGALSGELQAEGGQDGLTLELKINASDLLAGPLTAESVEAAVQANCESWQQLPPPQMEMTLTAQGKALTVKEESLDDWSLNIGGELDEGQLHFSELTLSDGNMRLEGDGLIALSDKEVTLALILDAAALRALPMAPAELPEGSLKGDLKITGSYDPLQLNFQMAYHTSPLEGTPASLAFLEKGALQLDAAGIYDGEELQVSEIHFSAPAASAEGTFSYTLATEEVTAALKGEVSSLQEISKGMAQSMSGRLAVEGSVQGTIKDLSANVDLRGAGIAVADSPIFDLHASLVASDLTGSNPEITIQSNLNHGSEGVELASVLTRDNHRFLLAPLTVESGQNILSGQVAYDVDAQDLEAALKIDFPDLAALGRLAGLACAGRMTGSVHAAQHALQAELQASALEFGEVQWASLRFNAALKDSGKGYAGTGNLQGTALTAGMMEASTVTVDADGDMDELALTLAAEGLLKQDSAEEQPFSVRMKHRLFPRDQRLILEETGGRVGTVDFGLEEPARVTALSSGLRIEPLQLRVGSGTVHLQGEWAGETLSGELRALEIPLDAAVPFGAPALSGAAEATISLSGTLKAPTVTAQFRAQADALSEEVVLDKNPLNLSGEFSLGAAGAALSMKAVLDAVAELNCQASVQAQVHLQPWLLEIPSDTGLSGTIDFDVQLEELCAVLGLDDHDVTGSATGAFTLGGGVMRPEVRGEAALHEVDYEFVQTGTRMDHVAMHLVAERDALRLVSCTADMGGEESMSATGEIRLIPEEDFPMEAQVHFREARFAELDYMNGRVSGDLQLKGSLKDALLKGAIKVTPMEVSMPDELPGKEAPELEVTELRDGQALQRDTKSSPGFAKRIRLDVDCEIPGKFYARAPILDSEWGGKLHVGGTLADIRIDGRVAVLRGHLDFLNRRFQLQDSALLFLDGAPDKPFLDMRAQVDTPSLKARLGLKGELSNVKLELSSDPVVPQDEILAQILFGRNLSRLSPVQAIQLARVAAMFNQGLGGVPFFSGNVKLPGIDRFDLRTGERADETSVGMGKYFTDSVYVEVEQGTTTDSGKVSVEVEVTPQISVKGDANAQERSGVGVFWKKDY